MISKFDGTCSECSLTIAKGEEILQNETTGKWVHESCAVSRDFQNDRPEQKFRQEEGVTYRLAGRRHPTRCDDCHLVHSGECF